MNSNDGIEQKLRNELAGSGLFGAGHVENDITKQQQEALQQIKDQDKEFDQMLDILSDGLDDLHVFIV